MFSESTIDRIAKGHFWKFHGGIHPPQQKTLTSTKPILSLPLPKLLTIPLQQHIGRQGDLLVAVGDYVLKGQPLTQSSNPMAVPVHAPTSGSITNIAPSVIAHPSGFSELCLFLQPDGEDKWIERHICENFTQLDAHNIIKKIADAGIAGMGGAGFPTHIKVTTKPDINFLIINAAECEPYITSDDLLMREQSESIVDGIKILDHLLTPAFILIGIEDNKPEAIKALQNATQLIEKVKVCVLPTKYPTGGEKQLIKILTGKEITSGSLPIHSGIVVQNVATCFAIADAVINDIPLIRRVVTVTGQALEKPQNVWALLGTPISYLLSECGYQQQSDDDRKALIMGGPMMGFSLASDEIPVVKTSNCILAPSIQEMPSAFNDHSDEVECIRCGQCAEVCPSQLLPQELQWSAKAKDHQQLNALNLFDCIDCGACAFVCPSQIPLVQYYRVAKAEIRQQQALDNKAEKAKARFEGRKARLAKEKVEREQKHKKAAEARKIAMNKNTADGGNAQSAVAAALARVKAKKAASANTHKEKVTDGAPEIVNDDVADQKSKVAAAIARAKAKKAGKTPIVNLPEGSSATETKSDQKVKQEVKQEVEPNLQNNVKTVNTKDIDSQNFTAESSDKKLKIAAAIARAKAKKSAKENPVTPLTPEVNVQEVKTKEEKTEAAQEEAKQEEAKQEEAKQEEHKQEEPSQKGNLPKEAIPKTQEIQNTPKDKEPALVDEKNWLR